MDQLKDSVSLRGYGQRDPLQEYKKEGYKLFEGLMGRIQDETTLALVRMPPPEQISQEEFHHDEVDDSSFQFNNPDAQAEGYASASSSGNGNDDDNMIYHGSRSGGGGGEPATPYVRDGEKVGRNDPCPCGSGKKYKKCHGRPGAEPLSPQP